MDFRAYLAVEAALQRRLVAAWKKKSDPLYARIESLVAAEKWGEALRLVSELDMTSVGQDNRKFIAFSLRAMAQYGGKLANNKKPEFHGEPLTKSTVDHVTDVLCQYFEFDATALVQTSALQLIAQAELAAKDKKYPVVKKEAPLYVCRRVENADEVIAWAKSVGFETTLLPEDLHVTLAYSSTPVDWYAEGVHETGLIVPNSPERALLRFGDAVVLTIPSPRLEARWRAFLGMGASWDYDSYQPHITLTYEPPAEIDLNKIQPFAGVVRLGAEVFEALDPDKEKVEKYNKNHGADGRFSSGADVPEVLATVFGEKLHIRDGDSLEVRGHLADLALMPPEHLTLAGGYIGGVYLGAVPVTQLDDLGDLAGVQPPGWDEGDTWDSVAGCCGERAGAPLAIGGGRHDCVSLAWHETAHAMDRASGDGTISYSEFSERRDFKPIRKIMAKICPYFEDRLEAFAGGYEIWMANKTGRTVHWPGTPEGAELETLLKYYSSLELTRAGKKTR